MGAAVVYGAVTSWLPAPADESFWVGNFSAPYLLLPFLVGACGAQSWRGAALLGVLVDWVIVIAFYSRELYDPARIASNHRGRQPAITLDQVLNWSVFLVDGPWLKLGVVAGVAFGLLGRWWARSPSVPRAAAIALPFMFEPLAWRAYEGRWAVSAELWTVEVVVGAAVLGLLLLVARGRREVNPPSPV